MRDTRELTQYIWRKSAWLARIGKWARPDYCKMCTRQKRCKRYLINERVINAFAKAKMKKNYKSQMRFLQDDEKCPDFDAILDYFMKPAKKGKKI